jgi:hypothetical protein
MDRGVGITPIHILSFLLHETMRCSFKMVKNTYKKGEFFPASFIKWSEEKEKYETWRLLCKANNPHGQTNPITPFTLKRENLFLTTVDQFIFKWIWKSKKGFQTSSPLSVLHLIDGDGAPDLLSRVVWKIWCWWLTADTYNNNSPSLIHFFFLFFSRMGFACLPATA